ncbi:uncharacterized protein EV420DRAFT_1050826 [Desarmillaria tabescens]|uniref:F-box domain-containing protein n=1 Tax=Armillaria tabescens TaxID=1929756 RepID=A0AA39TMX9_ARMTA|nr:uncharacterized protein EV420DRAFT_1050826 [Desarmillaria tabescens]KAK0464577.1 hypothetical protein EV420DRAFT_1050826 [Desarmillaria tabescens]
MLLVLHHFQLSLRRQLARCLASMTILAPPTTMVKARVIGTVVTDHSSLSSPIAYLPPELLIEVFAFCAAADGLSPLALGRVCRFWKEVVDFSPRIWQVITLDDRVGSIVLAQRQASVWLLRSAPLPFDVNLHASSPDHLFPLLSPCLRELDRWHRFTLSGHRQESVILTDLDIKSMERLYIVIRSDDGDFEDEELPRATFLEHSPMWPGEAVMNVWMTGLPPSRSLPPLHFTTITIVDTSFQIHLTASAILDFLGACPELRTLDFEAYIYSDERDSLPSPMVSLPYLSFLSLKSTSLTRAILSSINAPNLSELYLSYLNVDFDILIEGHDNGDSEDEANDFSRSPSSDHATGMGLRKLISRCNPPIRILEMDYSDMRTKDFLYVFDHLVTLEDFVIVASDMSDTVIRHLRPFWANNGTEMQVRLPLLQRLVLLHCHRLTGDIVVDVMKSRVQYTDRLSSPAATLSELMVSECEGFTDSHAQLLRKELGNRFKDE